MKQNAQSSRKAKSSAFPVQGSRQFIGTSNPRQIRALRELVRCNFVWRKTLDAVAGATNSPALVAELRRRGLELPCERVVCFDRDNRESRPGRYSLSASDRRKVLRWLSKRIKGNAA